MPPAPMSTARQSSPGFGVLDICMAMWNTLHLLKEENTFYSTALWADGKF